MAKTTAKKAAKKSAKQPTKKAGKKEVHRIETLDKGVRREIRTHLKEIRSVLKKAHLKAVRLKDGETLKDS